MKKNKTLQLTLTAILIALVFVSTVFLTIKLPIKANGGLIHLGTATLFIAAILFGPKKGAVAGALGMGLFDVVGGWLLWAPITVVARGLQGWIVGAVAASANSAGGSIWRNSLGILLSIPVMVAVYYVGEAVLYGNWIAPLASIPGDLVQNFLGFVIAVPVCAFLQKVPAVQRFGKEL